MHHVAEAFAPGSIGNVGPGLDILGLAVAGAGDTVIAERRDRRGIDLVDPGHPSLPADPARHASALAAIEKALAADPHNKEYLATRALIKKSMGTKQK